MLISKQVFRTVFKQQFVSRCFASARYPLQPLSRLTTGATRLSSTQRPTSTTKEWGRNSRQNVKKSLRQRSQQWLRQEVGSWRGQDSNMARSLLEQWMLMSSDQVSLEKARTVTRIYHKWIAKTSVNSERDYSYFVEYLNQILHVWKQARPTNKQDLDKARDIFQFTLQTAQSTKNSSILPQDKTFSSLFNLLAVSKSSEAMDEARTILTERLKIKDMAPPDPQFWNSFLNVLAKSSSTDPTLVDEAEEMLEALQGEADEQTVASVMEALVHSGKPEAGERAQRLLDQMTNAGVLNSVCFNLTIEAWAVTGHPEKAEACLREMIRLYGVHSSQIAPDAKSFLAAVKGWSRVGDVERAQQLVDLMQSLQHKTGQAAISPSAEVFVAILQAWAKRGNAGRQVNALLQASIGRFLHNDDTVEDNWLSPQAFTVAINAWTNTSDAEAPWKAEKLIDQMDRLHTSGSYTLVPNHFHYSAVINAWATCNRNDVSEGILRILSRCNEKLGPHQGVFNSALSAMGRHGYALDADSLLSEMKSLGTVSGASIAPDSDSYTSVIRAYYKAGHRDAPARSDELLQEIEDMFDDGQESLKPSEASYIFTILAQSLKSVESAEQVFWKMVQRHRDDGRCTAPTLRICNKILELWAHSADGHAAQKAENLLRWLSDDGCGGVLHPDECSYQHVVDAWGRSGRRSAPQRIENILHVIGRGAK